MKLQVMLAAAVVAVMVGGAMAGPAEIALWPVRLSQSQQRVQSPYALTGVEAPDREFRPSTKARELKQSLPTGRNTVGIGGVNR